MLPVSIAQRYPRPGVDHVPIVDAPAALLTIAWHEHARALITAALAQVAITVADRHAHAPAPSTTHP